jgi:hypothetical protein
LIWTVTFDGRGNASCALSRADKVALELPLIDAPPSPPPPRTLDLLVDFARAAKSALPGADSSVSTGVANGEDRKPTLAEMEQSTNQPGAQIGPGQGGNGLQRVGPVPMYAHVGAPGLPGAWTRPRWDRVSLGMPSRFPRPAVHRIVADVQAPKPDDLPPPESLLVTASSLDFVRKSASSGDIPPELGIVNYRLVQGKDRKRGFGSDDLAPLPLRPASGSTGGSTSRMARRYS